MLNWKKSVLLLGIKFRGHAKEEEKQQPATGYVDGLSNQEKITLKIYQLYTFSHS